MYWNDLNTHLKRQYGCKVYKLALSSGCSCPNRDGTLGVRGCIFLRRRRGLSQKRGYPRPNWQRQTAVAAKAGQGAKYSPTFSPSPTPTEPGASSKAVSDGY